MKQPGNQSKRKFNQAESTDDDENVLAAPAKKPKKSAQDADDDSEAMKTLELAKRHNQRAASKIAAAKKVLLKNERRAKTGGDDKLKEEIQQLKRDLAASEKRNKALDSGTQMLVHVKDDKLEVCEEEVKRLAKSNLEQSELLRQKGEEVEKLEEKLVKREQELEEVKRSRHGYKEQLDRLLGAMLSVKQEQSS